MEPITKADLIELRDTLVEVMEASENRLLEQIVEHLKSMEVRFNERVKQRETREDQASMVCRAT